MLKLQGTDDLTLVRFLLSCQSTGETAEYITAYLGKSTEVSHFTAEFLRRKFAESAGKKVRCAPWASHPCGQHLLQLHVTGHVLASSLQTLLGQVPHLD
jgi:hypothetical protein